MSGRYFLDTNIFVYSVDQSEPVKAEIARGFIRNAISTERGVISYQVVQEFFSVAFRRFLIPIRPEDGELYFRSTLEPLLRVHSSPLLLLEALRLFRSAGIAWYDSLIVSAALQANCTKLYSEDLQHGRTFGALSIVNPFL